MSTVSEREREALQRTVGRIFGGQYAVPSALEDLIAQNFGHRGWDSPGVQEMTRRLRYAEGYLSWEAQRNRDLTTRVYSGLGLQPPGAPGSPSARKDVAAQFNLSAAEEEQAVRRGGTAYTPADAMATLEQSITTRPVLIAGGINYGGTGGGVEHRNGQSFIPVKAPGDMEHKDVGAAVVENGIERTAGVDGRSLGALINGTDLDDQGIQAARTGLPDRQPRRLETTQHGGPVATQGPPPVQRRQMLDAAARREAATRAAAQRQQSGQGGRQLG